MSEPVQPKDADRTVIEAPVTTEYRVLAGAALSRHLEALAEGRFVGQRCPTCSRVYMPPIAGCSICAVPTEEDVELPDTGTVTTYCVVNLDVRGQGLDVPFCAADVRLDGADTTFMALIQECPYDEVRMGMRVEAVWAPPEERGPTIESVRYFRPLDEPDVPLEELGGGA